MPFFWPQRDLSHVLGTSCGVVKYFIVVVSNVFFFSNIPPIQLDAFQIILRPFLLETSHFISILAPSRSPCNFFWLGVGRFFFFFFVEAVSHIPSCVVGKKEI